VPEVSVVTAVRNGEAYLAEAIDSVLQQAVPLEYIVVDDGSTDRSAQIAAAYGDRLTLLRQPAAGVAAALNHGIARASAPFLAFLDADDVWEPNKLSRQLALFEQDPGLTMVFGARVEFASGAAAADRGRWSVRTQPHEACYAGGILIRTDAVRRCGGFDESLALGAFIDLAGRIRDAGGRQEVTGDLVVRRRVHGGNLSIAQAGARQDFLTVARAALRRRRAAG
jgi:glycosyltransferase involved in cell wall biosynthesis